MSHNIGRSKVVQEIQELPDWHLLVVSPRLVCEIVQLNSGHLWKSAAQASSATTQPAALQFRNANFTPRVSQASVVAPVPLLLCGTFAPTVCYRVAHWLSEPSSRTPVLRSTCLEHRTLPPSSTYLPHLVMHLRIDQAKPELHRFVMRVTIFNFLDCDFGTNTQNVSDQWLQISM